MSCNGALQLFANEQGEQARLYARRVRQHGRRRHCGLRQPRGRHHHRPVADLTPRARAVAGMIQNEKKPENGRHDVTEVAPDQAETSGSLRAIFDKASARRRIASL